MIIPYSIGGILSYKNFISAAFENQYFVLNELFSEQHRLAPLPGPSARSLNQLW